MIVAIGDLFRGETSLDAGCLFIGRSRAIGDSLGRRRSCRSYRSSGVAEFMGGSPVGFDFARVGNKELGNFFQESLHISRVAVPQIASQNQVILALFKGALR